MFIISLLNSKKFNQLSYFKEKILFCCLIKIGVRKLNKSSSRTTIIVSSSLREEDVRLSSIKFEAFFVSFDSFPIFKFRD